MTQEKMKLNVPEWIVRGFVAACCGLVLTYGRSFVRDVVKEEVQPVINRVDKLNEKVDRLGVQVEVIVAVERERQQTKRIQFNTPYYAPTYTTNQDGIKLIPFNYGQNTNNY